MLIGFERNKEFFLFTVGLLTFFKFEWRDAVKEEAQCSIATR